MNDSGDGVWCHPENDGRTSMNSRGCAVIEVEHSGHGGVAFDAFAGIGGAVEVISTSLRAVFGGGVRYYERWQDAAKAIALWTNTP